MGRPVALTALAWTSIVVAGCGGLNGEDPEAVVEALHREEALKVAVPGATPVGDVMGGADSGSAVGTQWYVHCGPEVIAKQYFLGALEPLGWRRVERPGRWVKRVADRQAELYLEYPRPTPNYGYECAVTIYANYESGLIGDVSG